MKTTLAILALACLQACGGGSDAPAPRAAQLMVIGNSLATHPITASLGWDHVSGMAASDAAHDYAHLVAAARGESVVARNFASLERNPADPINTIDTTTPMKLLIESFVAGIDVSTDVVVQLGDNAPVGGSADFTTNYMALLDALPPHRSLVCVSTWWQDDAKDAMIKASCAAAGGVYVYIGDIYPTRKDVIPAGQNSGVAEHPHDPSMAAIAARITAQMPSP